MMNHFTNCFENHDYILMEGALGERLKREYQLEIDTPVVMGNLVYSQEGRHALKCLWNEYAQIAYQHGLPFIATTPTRRVNSERVAMAGYSEAIIRDNVEYLKAIQEEQKGEMYIGGMLGCKGDAYTGQGCLKEEEAEAFHNWEIEQFVLAGVDFLYAALIPTVEEALGIARAISQYHVPYIISFTIKADGCLIDGTPISKAIDLIDSAVELKPLCYMTNCVHPNIAYTALTCPINDNSLVKQRFLGIQANTSELPYDKLDGSIELKSSSPNYLAECIMKLQSVQKLKIIGGCCGTDNRHMNVIADRLTKDKGGVE